MGTSPILELNRVQYDYNIRLFEERIWRYAIEYGLIAAGISIAIIAVVNGLGTQLNDKFTSISTQLK